MRFALVWLAFCASVFFTLRTEPALHPQAHAGTAPRAIHSDAR
ncbi:MAG TPA: hypothetical protein VMK05_13285 [Burkholderiales bacterium]|nr:hypothetical protein [Burkholderiales bacterium]